MFSERLREIRGEKSRRVMAEALSVPEPTYLSWETGAREPSISKIIVLAKSLQVSTDYLLGVSDIKNPYEPQGGITATDSTVVNNSNNSPVYTQPKCKDCAALAALSEVISNLTSQQSGK